MILCCSLYLVKVLPLAIKMMGYETNDCQMFSFLDQAIVKHHQWNFLWFRYSATDKFFDLMDTISNKRFESFRIAPNICQNYLPSVQKIFFKPSICNSFLNKDTISTGKTAAVNSSLGIDINLFGETLDFRATNCNGSMHHHWHILCNYIPHIHVPKHQWWMLISIIALFPTLAIDISALHQQSHPIAHCDCIDVEVAVLLPIQMD